VVGVRGGGDKKNPPDPFDGTDAPDFTSGVYSAYALPVFGRSAQAL
jgi:hypothetical protein